MNTSKKELKKERGAYFPLLLPVSHTESLIKRLMNLMLLTYGPQTSLFQLIFQNSAIQQNVYCATLTQTSIYCRKLLKFTVLFSIQKNSMLIQIRRQTVLIITDIAEMKLLISIDYDPLVLIK